MVVNKKKILGLILSHNCEKLIAKTLSRIPENIFDQIIVSDDGSTDKSVITYRELGYEVFETNVSGYGSNIKNGLKSAFSLGADYVVEIHGDGAQFDPAATCNALKYMDLNVDLILGSRFINKKRALELGMPMPRFIANQILSFIDRLILRKNLSEFHTGFRIYNKTMRNINTHLYSNDYLYSFEIIAGAIEKGMSVNEIEVECDYRNEHTSHGYLGASIYAISHIYTLIQFILKKYFNLKIGIFKNE